MPYPAFPLLGKGVHSVAAPGSQRSAEPAVLTAKFGGGYGQRTGDGINSMRRNFMFKSRPIRTDSVAILEAFLVDRKGYLPFTYQVPGEATARQFTCAKWTTDYAYPLHWTVSGMFEENFDP